MGMTLGFNLEFCPTSGFFNAGNQKFHIGPNLAPQCTVQQFSGHFDQFGGGKGKCVSCSIVMMESTFLSPIEQSFLQFGMASDQFIGVVKSLSILPFFHWFLQIIRCESQKKWPLALQRMRQSSSSLEHVHRVRSIVLTFIGSLMYISEPIFCKWSQHDASCLPDRLQPMSKSALSQFRDCFGCKK